MNGDSSSSLYSHATSSTSRSDDYRAALAELEKWHNNPTDEPLNRRVQQVCLDYLLAQDDPHWFCDTCDESSSGDENERRARKAALHDVALFCVRLVGYKATGKVLSWKQHLVKLLLECTSCVKGWMEAKRDVKDKYLLKRWPLDTVKSWYTSVHAKERERIHEALEASNTAKTLHVPLVYNILLDPELYSQPDILDALANRLPTHPFDAAEWPRTSAIPSGMLLLLVHHDARLRDWAREISKAVREMTAKDWEEKDCPTPSVVAGLLEAVSRRDHLLARDKALPSQATVYDVKLTNSQPAFWKGMVEVIRLLSKDVLKTYFGGGGSKTDIVRLVSGHLGDRDERWIFVLQAFTILLEKLDEATWTNLIAKDHKGKGRATEVGSELEEGDEGVSADLGYAGARLYDALDNPQFLLILEEISQKDDSAPRVAEVQSALFGWLFPFLRSLRGTPFFAPCFTAIATRFLDEYGQKTRFALSTRQGCIKAVMRVFTDIFSRISSPLSPSTWPHLDQAASDIERHSKIIAEVAFSSEYTSEESWHEASRSAQRFITVICKRNASCMRDYVYWLSDVRNSKDPASTKIPSLLLCEAPVVQAASILSLAIDVKGVATIIQTMAATCYIPRLASRAWLSSKQEQADKNIRLGLRNANEGLEKLNAPLTSILRSLAEEDPLKIKEVLAMDGVAEAVTGLILSPTEVLASAAQSVIRQAYDASTRQDCFRSLLHNLPDQTLKGVISSLRILKESATRLPEACGQAKRIVRCLTDIVAILCDPTETLIRDDRWVEEHNMQTSISKLWNLMCADIALIFEKTERWASMFENNEMTDWMRDALIFLSEMLDEIRTFEAAATGVSRTTTEPTPQKMSSRGREMIESLNEPLNRLTAWLRLNDKDLLEQTSTIITRAIERFAKAKLPISPDVVKRLRRLAEKYSDAKSRKEQLLTREQIASLLGALSHHPDYRDEFAKFSLISASSTKDEPISLDSDEDSESEGVEVVASSGRTMKAKHDPSGLPKVKGKLALATKGTTKLLSSSKATTKSPAPPPGPSATFKVAKGQPAQPLSKYRTAPTKMKNAIYSHAAMRAAKDTSSSDEDWSGANRASGLARLAEQRAKMETAVLKQQGPRQTKMLELQGQNQRSLPSRRGQRIMTAAEIQRNNQNKARMRYNPDYTDLHRQILQWNYRHSSALPYDGFRYPRSIPPTFENPAHYIDTFLPLLLLECWNEIATAREELEQGTAENEPFTARMAGRVSVDDFVEVFMAVDRLPERSPVTENDIVLLKGHCHVIGKIHQIVRKQQKIDIAVRVHLGRDDGNVSRNLVNGTQWSVHKLFTLSTAHREYAGLMSLPYYDLVDEILVPPHHPKPGLDVGLLERAMKAYRVNKPQAEAIVSALSSRGFSLIQGPPGTGKTKTILGLVGAFLSNRGQRAGTIPGSDAPTGQKLLICAPSNAAVDEVAKRLKEGVYDSEGKRFTAKVVRIGSEFSINVSVHDIFLDNLVEKALGGERGTAAGDAHARMTAARSEMANLRTERDEKRSEKNNIVNNHAMLTKLSSEISELSRKIDDIAEKLDRERDTLTQANRAQEASKRKIRQEILADADVICTTLSGSGHEYLASYDFETVIIDEAAQSVEISSLIPLRYNCQRCIMVGDPNQLPPTVKSREATNAGYNKSLFVRLHTAAPEATHLLSIQYRMHPDISSFPSRAFYESRLSDGPDMAAVTKQGWHEMGDLFPPYAFLHVRGSREEAGKHHSLVNRTEANLAAALYSRLLRDCRGTDLSFRVGIITPYKGQVGELRRTFRRQFGEDILSKVDFNTVDGFQGQEKDIIILSCVRGGKGEGHGVGFLSDTRRMNVALTRARSSLFVLGDSKALQANEHWRKLVEDASERGVLKEVDTNTYAGGGQKVAAAPPITKKAAGKGRASDAASKKIMSAPDGLLTPSQLAKRNSGLGGNMVGTEDIKPAIGAKRRLLESMDQQDSPSTIKKSRNASINSNAAPVFEIPHVKAEELEEGEVPMSGVEYTQQPSGASPSIEQPSAKTSTVPPSISTATVPFTSSSSLPPSTVAGHLNQIPSDVKPSVPTLVPPKKPAASSLFIQRKRPGIPPKPAGR